MFNSQKSQKKPEESWSKLPSNWQRLLLGLLVFTIAMFNTAAQANDIVVERTNIGLTQSGKLSIDIWSIRSSQTMQKVLSTPTISAKGTTNRVASSTKTTPKKIFIQAGLHGNEKFTVVFADWLIDRLKSESSPLSQLVKSGKIIIDILPKANPDGLQSQTRLNERGVNLNRNFATLFGLTREYPGSKPFSEAETKTIKNLFERKKYDIAIDIHGYINWIVSPTSPSEMISKASLVTNSQEKRQLEQQTQKRQGQYDRLTTVLQQTLNMLSGYQLKSAGGLGDGGAFEDWAFWQAGADSFCLEIMPRKNLFLRMLQNPWLVKSLRQRDFDFIRYENYLVANIKKLISDDKILAGR